MNGVTLGRTVLSSAAVPLTSNLHVLALAVHGIHYVVRALLVILFHVHNAIVYSSANARVPRLLFESGIARKGVKDRFKR